MTPDFTICEDCWGESDMMDDAFRCGTCRGRHWLCEACGKIEQECCCEDDQEPDCSYCRGTGLSPYSIRDVPCRHCAGQG